MLICREQLIKHFGRHPDSVVLCIWCLRNVIFLKLFKTRTARYTKVYCLTTLASLHAIYTFLSIFVF